MKKNNPKIISQKEHRLIMLDMLKFIDQICRKNHINYSLLGGSLIGAIRHKGYIPWDDDIDIVLTKENYDKLKKLLDNETGIYQTLKYHQGGKCFSFTKLIDTRTRMTELLHYKIGKDYGVYVDIFCYYPTSSDPLERKKHYQKLKCLKSIITRYRIDFKNRSFRQNFIWLCENIVSRLVGYKRINRWLDKELNKYVNTKSNYLVANWPTYGLEKEVQQKKNTKEYIDAEFEGIKVMIFKNYDEILRTTFGDYMQLPPESERAPKHNVKIWWKEAPYA